jgi:CheY-like chemotaxis protein
VRGALAFLDDDEMDLDLVTLCHREAQLSVPLVTFTQPGALLKWVDDLHRRNAYPAHILLDIYMPGTTGFDVAESVMARYPGAGGLVFFCTSPHPEDAERARQMGVPLLLKPSNLNGLTHLLLRLTAGALAPPSSRPWRAARAL